MVIETDYTRLSRKGLIDTDTKRIIEVPFIASGFGVHLHELDEYAVPQNIVKVANLVCLNFGNCLGMNEEILNFIFELDEKCDNEVELWFTDTEAFTQSDWDLFVEHIVNNSSLKFGEYVVSMTVKHDITFNLNTDRKLRILNFGNGILTFKGKMGVVRYWMGDTDNLKVEGKFKDIVDLDGNSIIHKLFDYDNLPDMYESLESRLRRLTS